MSSPSYTYRRQQTQFGGQKIYFSTRIASKTSPPSPSLFQCFYFSFSLHHSPRALNFLYFVFPNSASLTFSFVCPCLSVPVALTFRTLLIGGQQA
ncbi:unnamed protein product [Meloidogyne enterolobii]|uniref:Uncharacterized protein n=2 Tax=Meloidogyne enterolobii TaxID=390850 RepID=A0ACB0XLF3_MELEN|nr:unnamed protein product [Meloidogyne enterolobii]